MYYYHVKLSNFSYVLEKVDLVFLGAEGVVESGGIINKVSNKLNKNINFTK